MSGGYAAFAKRYWSCNWQEAVTVIRETPNGWRIRWETGPKSGRCATITRRNWSIMPRNVRMSDGGRETFGG